MSSEILVDVQKNDQTVKNYSESFKFKVLSELETGKYTKNEIIQFYNVNTGSLLIANCFLFPETNRFIRN